MLPHIAHRSTCGTGLCRLGADSRSLGPGFLAALSSSESCACSLGLAPPSSDCSKINDE